MFVVVRYIGLCWIMATVLFDTSFIVGPPEVCSAIFQILGWSFTVILSATDLMMILRVYSMWNRSRIILSTLLFIFMLQTIAIVILDAIYCATGTLFSVTTAQVLDFSFCSVVSTSLAPQVFRGTLQLVLSAALVISAVSQTLKQSFEMYQATKQWQPNRYMQRLLGDGILYFIVNGSFQVYGAIILIENPMDITSIFLTTLLCIAFVTLIPRFIISIRELYDRDIHARFHIDTGFGAQLQPNAGAHATVSAVVFVDRNQAPEVEDATGNFGDLETGGMHGLGLNEDSIGGGE